MDINAITNGGIQPVDPGTQEYVPQETKAAAVRSDGAAVSPEALQMAELVEAVQAMPDERPEAVQTAVQSSNAGAYQAPEVLSRTSDELLKQI